MSLNHGGIFTALTIGTIDDSAGLVDNFGGGTFNLSQGVEPEWVRLGYVNMNATTGDPATFSVAAGNRQFAVANEGNIPFDDVLLTSTVTVNPLDHPTEPSLIGIDLGGGVVPSNWTSFSGFSDTTFSNLLDESGATTPIDVLIDFDSIDQRSYEGFNPPAGELPQHTQSLAGLDRNLSELGNVELTYSDLVAGQFYEIYVFAGDAFSGAQYVTISEPTSEVQLAQFSQSYSANQLFINGEVGDSSRDLSSYAVVVAADKDGELKVRVDSRLTPGGFFGLPGIAIREGMPPLPEVLIGDATVNESSGTADFSV